MNKAKDEARCWKLWLRTRAQRVAAFAVLLMSVTWVVFGLCVVLPWGVVGYAGYRLFRRIGRPARPAVAASPTQG